MVNNYCLVVWNMAGLFSIILMGCHPKPIDELHHFSRWLYKTTNQINIIYLYIYIFVFDIRMVGFSTGNFCGSESMWPCDTIFIIQTLGIPGLVNIQKAIENGGFTVYGFMGKSWEYMGIPSGNLVHSYWKWPFLEKKIDESPFS